MQRRRPHGEKEDHYQDQIDTSEYLPADELINANPSTIASKSIIKKQSAYKEEVIKHSKSNKQEYSGEKKLIRKVQFADLAYVDDVDDYMRNEESNYHKVTRMSKPKR